MCNERKHKNGKLWDYSRNSFIDTQVSLSCWFYIFSSEIAVSSSAAAGGGLAGLGSHLREITFPRNNCLWSAVFSATETHFRCHFSLYPPFTHLLRLTASSSISGYCYFRLLLFKMPLLCLPSHRERASERVSVSFQYPVPLDLRCHWTGTDAV